MQPPEGDGAHDSKPLDEAPYDVTARPPRIVAAIFASRQDATGPLDASRCGDRRRTPITPDMEAGGRAPPSILRRAGATPGRVIPRTLTRLHDVKTITLAHVPAGRADRGQSRACDVVPPHQKHAERPRTLNVSVVAARDVNGRRRVVLAERQPVILPGRGPKFPAQQAQYAGQSGPPSRRRPILSQQRRR
ncbi:hypothetical protein FA95DRAFT_1613552 [Auriscalpium vulgare]|uniref:Uncharacterized protein n=1 Tax=Auriscalpium vulgare TaxID=40419 RepID=A0ACB8R398_9AGAM|nr:hypothetical protein FA95DRAFT_1613552 [Auriscalpium vulgare]